MTRDLPKTVPSAVLVAADKAIGQSIALANLRFQAMDTYHSDGYRKQENWTRGHAKFDDLLAKAQALVDWGAGLRDALQPSGLFSQFQTVDGHCPGLSVVNHEVILTAREGFPGGKLVTELELELDADRGLFRHHVWFDGFRVAGGGLLNTANGLHLAMHPEMLSQIHTIVAEGQNWPRVKLSFNRLVELCKDR